MLNCVSLRSLTALIVLSCALTASHEEEVEALLLSIPTVVSHCSSADAQRILYLWMASYERSYATMLIGKCGILPVERTAQSWIGAIARRRNPSIQLTLSEAPEPLFSECYQQFHAACTAYATVTQAVLIDHPPVDRTVQRHLADVRRIAQRIIHERTWERVCTAQTELESVLAALASPLRVDIRLSDELPHQTRGAWTTLLQTGFQAWSLKKFIEFDIAFIKTTRRAHKLLATAHRLYNEIWQLIEQERAQWYGTIYTAWYTALNAAHASDEVYRAPRAPIFLSHEPGLLPHPDQLSRTVQP